MTGTRLNMNGRLTDPHDVTRITLAVLFIGLLIAGAFWVLSPFLISFLWASMIVVSTWPVLLRLQARLWGRRGLAVAAMIMLLLLMIVLPFSLSAAAIIDQAGEIATVMKSLVTFAMQPPPEWIANIPLAGPQLAGRWQQLASLSPEEITAWVLPYAQDIVKWFVAQAGSLGAMFLHFLITLVIAAILYSAGEKAAAGVLSFFRRLAGKPGEDAAILAAKAVRGVALGVVVTALLQSILGGFGLMATGVPAAAFLTGVLFMLCLAQIGPVPVLIPAVVWLFWKDGALKGSVLLAISILTITVDNFVRPVLIRKSADLPLILIFAGVIGGLIAFGVIGLFIGPAVLAVTFTLLQAWISGDEPQTLDVSAEEP